MFDRLAACPATIEDLATEFDAAPRAVEAMVAVLAGADFLRPARHGTFDVTETARAYLVKSSPFYRTHLCLHDQPSLDQLRRAFRAGGSGRGPRVSSVHGGSPEELARFVRHMQNVTLGPAEGLARQPWFSKIRRLLDVGGGAGSICAAIASRHPGIECTILEFGGVCAMVREVLAVHQLQHRIRIVEGDMFRSAWPPHHDCVLFANILHNWDADDCRFLLRRAFESLPAGGYVLIHEMLLNDRKDGPLPVACFSVNMLLFEQGKQYTPRELRCFLTEVGFRAVESTPTFGYYSLVRAMRPLGSRAATSAAPRRRRTTRFRSGPKATPRTPGQ